MSATETTISKCLEEVWEWKEAVYQDTKDMSMEEKQAYFREGLELAAKTLGAQLVKNPDGSHSLV
jgi:hypothetical protein